MISAQAAPQGPTPEALTPEIGGEDAALRLGSGTAPPSISATASHAPLAQASQVAQHIMHALREHRFDPGAPIDLALDPPELGKLRLSVIETATGMSLLITAERAETADLMRRHLALLAEAFGQEGLDPPSVSISHGEAGTDAREEDRAERAISDPDQITADASETVTPQSAPQPGDGLDLRL